VERLAEEMAEELQRRHPAPPQDGGRVCPIAWLGLLLAHIAMMLAARVDLMAVERAAGAVDETTRTVLV
jgi:hypothetical protein